MNPLLCKTLLVEAMFALVATLNNHNLKLLSQVQVQTYAISGQGGLCSLLSMS